MMLPMLGFLFALIIVGALASLVAVGNFHRAPLALFIGFTSLFAGIGALVLSMGLGFLGETLNHHLGMKTLDGLGFFGGYTFGGLGGALLGLRSALLRSKRHYLP
jgi:hypothetical protein